MPEAARRRGARPTPGPAASVSRRCARRSISGADRAACIVARVVTVVIPFVGAQGKRRLHSSSRIRRALAHAMFCDVLAACVLVGRTRVVTPDEDTAAAASEAGAEAVVDPGGGQGAAVQAGLEG